ncbi:MFS transporter [Infirmifilum lucidum]|uniref:Lysosomal dipeptide transporter MFSD1 n=1 Tax=Infirmifilum lucidum TaxID=2776706 RepID=A0A7L9FFN9_9CREN|nr:MFS transporter [Infirmifilum lucidum]QOJ78628.1 MFS transporter [Infirmifilum lucidum]
MERNRLYLALATLYSLYFLVYVHRTITGVLKPELTEVAGLYGLDAVFLTSSLASTYFYAYSAMQLPAGVLADALGVRKYVSISAGIMSAGVFLFASARPQLMLLGRLLIGAGAAAVYVSIQRVIGIYASQDRGGLLTGLALSIGNIGALFATLPSRVVIDALGFSNFFVVLAVSSSLLTIAPTHTIADEGLGSKGVVEGLKKTISQLKIAATSYHSIAVALAYTGTYSAVLAFQSYWAYEYLQKNFGMSKEEVAQALLLLALAFLATVPLVGYTSDSILKKRKPILVAGCFLHSAAWFTAILLPATSSRAAVNAYMLVLGLVASTHMVISPMAREAYPPEFSGTTFAFVNMVGFLAVAVYQSLGLVVKDPVHILALFSVASLVSGLLALRAKETMNS